MGTTKISVWLLAARSHPSALLLAAQLLGVVLLLRSREVPSTSTPAARTCGPD